MSKTIDRRKFFKDTAISAAGILFASIHDGSSVNEESGKTSYDIMKDVMKYRKIDAHTHIFTGVSQTPEWHLDYADRLGIGKLQISRPSLNFLGRDIPKNPEEVKECNDIILKAMKKYPDRFMGFFTLNPFFRQESFDEINRRVDQGFTGYKGAWQVKVNDPIYFPIIEKLIDLKMICFMHAECQLGAGGYRMKYDIKERPNVTIPEDFVDIAKRYPQAIFQWAHIGGGGDWEYMCKSFKDYPNIFVDTSGSNNEENMIDFAVRYLGEDRLFFGSDNSYYEAVGKILASNLTEAQKRKIFFDNYNNILRKGGRNVA
jgi:uncharacterized protein